MRPFWYRHTARTGKVVGPATGFVTDTPSGPVLVTNRHVVTGRHNVSGETLLKSGFVPAEIEVFHHRKSSTEGLPEGAGGHVTEWVPRRETLYEAEVPRWREHPTLGARMDVVALPLTNVEDVKLLALPIAAPTGLRIAYGPADAISVIGFPFGLTAGGKLAIWLSGYVASEPMLNAWEDLPGNVD